MSDLQAFPVRVVEFADMDSLKRRPGVPADPLSCHTAEVDGYVVESHVPAAALHRRCRAACSHGTGGCPPARRPWIS